MKRILFVTYHNPFDIGYGAGQRSNILLNAAVNNGYMVDIAYIGQAEQSCPEIDNPLMNVVVWGYQRPIPRSKINIRWNELILNVFPVDYYLEKTIDTLIRVKDYTYIMCRYIIAAEQSGLYKYRNKLILDIDDLPHQVLETHLSDRGANMCFVRKVYTYLSLQSTLLRENKWFKSKVSFLPDKELAIKKKVEWLPNIPLCTTDRVQYITNNFNLLFIGILSYPPNYEAIDYFVDNVLPWVVKKQPNVILKVAGKNLPHSISDKWKNNPNVEELGFVADINEFYRMGNIAISPIQSGGGTNIKVVEAMNMGKACVLSEFSTKGFEDILVQGENSYIAKNDEEYVNYIVELLGDSTLCSLMQKKAYSTVKRHFSQNKIDEIFTNALLK